MTRTYLEVEPGNEFLCIVLCAVVETGFMKNFVAFLAYKPDLRPAQRQNLNETTIWLRSKSFLRKI